MATILGCETLSPPRGSLLLATGLRAFPLLSRIGVHQPGTEAVLSETTWVTWLDLGLKMQARIFEGITGAGWPGVVRPPLFRGKGLVVPDMCPHTCNTGHLTFGHLMRPGSPPSGHPTRHFSKTTAALQDGFAAAACVRDRHFLSCASVFQADGRGGARVGGVPGELPGGLACAPLLESQQILRPSVY